MLEPVIPGRASASDVAGYQPSSQLPFTASSGLM